METSLWPTVDHLDPPDLPRHGCNSDRGPAASGGLTVLANDRNGGRLRLNASRHDDDDDVGKCVGIIVYVGLGNYRYIVRCRLQQRTPVYSRLSVLRELS